MQNLQIIEKLWVSFLGASISGALLWFFYSQKNTHIRDDQLSERGCSLFALMMFLIAAILQMTLEFRWWNIVMLVACIALICDEIFSKIPKAVRIEKAKENKEPLYTACGFRRMPPDYDIG
jgi:hypothetical protein